MATPGSGTMDSRSRTLSSTFVRDTSPSLPALTQSARSPLNLEQESRVTQKKRSRSPSRSSQAPLKRKRLDFTSEVQVIVGQDQQVINIPKTILTKSSNFLQSTCSELSDLKADAKIRLPWALPEIFAIYQQYIYTGDVVILDIEEEEDDAKVESFRKLMTALVQAYTLGDMLADPTFKNGVMDVLMEEYARLDLLPTAKEITRAYSATLPGSRLREALVAMYCYRIDMRWLEEHAGVLPARFLSDVVCAFAGAHDRGVRLGDPVRMQRCVFHEHGDGDGVGGCV